MQKDYREDFRTEWTKRLKDEKISKLLKLYIPAMLGHEQIVGGEARFDGANFIKAFLHDSCRMLLLLGDSGSGKTLFGLWITRELWSHQSEFVPLHIHLPALDIKDDFLSIYLRIHYNLLVEDIEYLKKKMKFLLILDAYDEMRMEHKKKNLYRFAKLYQWDIKVIITCRTEALNGYNLDEQLDVFQPYQNDQTPIRYGYQKIYMQRFELQTQILNYINLWKSQGSTLIDHDIDYYQEIQIIPDLANMVSNPFMLWIVLRALPAILAEYSKKPPLEKYSQTRLEIYDVFTEKWFERQKNKLKRNQQLSIEWEKTILEDYRNFCTQLANFMWQYNLTSIEYTPEKAQEEILLADEKKIEMENLKNVFFAEKGLYDGDPDKPLSLLRHGALLRIVGKNNYAFMHNTLLEYFGAKHLFCSAIQKASIRVGSTINAMLIVNDMQKIRFAVDKVKTDQEFENALWDIIEESKSEERVQIAAANAITILVAADKTFYGKDMRRIRIRYANLHGGNFERVDFSEADLRDVNFSDAWLCNTNFFGTCLDRITTNELYQDIIDSAVIHCGFANNDANYVVVSQLSVYYYQTEQHTLIKKIRILGILTYIFNDRHKITNAVIAADSEHVLLGTNQGDLIYVNIRLGKVISEWSGGSNPIVNVALSRNGEWAFSGEQDSELIKKWNCKTKQLVLQWRTSDDLIDLNLSHKNDWVLTQSKTGHVEKWDVDTGALLKRSKSSKVKVKIRISVDDRCIYTNVAGEIYRCDSRTHHTLSKLPGSVRRIYTLSQDARLLISAFGSTIYCWECDTNVPEYAYVLRGDYYHITSIAISSDNKLVLAGDYGGNIKRWSLLQKNTELIDNASPVAGIVVAREGSWLISFVKDRNDITTLMWDYQKGEKITSWNTIPDEVFTPDGTKLCYRTEPINHFTDEHGVNYSITAYQDSETPEYNKIYINSDKTYTFLVQKGKIVIHDYQTQKHLATWDVGYGEIIKFALSFDGKWALAVLGSVKSEIGASRVREYYYQEKILVWNCLGDGSPIKDHYNWGYSSTSLDKDKLDDYKLEIGHKSKKYYDRHIVAVALSPTGSWVVYSKQTRQLVFTRTNDEDFEKKIDVPFPVTIIHWYSLDDSLLVLAMSDGSVSAWSFDEKSVAISLRWRSNRWTLFANNSRMGGVYGLAETQQKLFKQKQSAVTISARSSEDQVEKDGKLKKGILNLRKNWKPYLIGQKLLSINNNHSLNQNMSAVTIARKKSGAGESHAFLILENIEPINSQGYYYRIRRFDYFIDERHQRSKWFGQGLIEIADCSVEDIRELLTKCEYKSSGITAVQTENLLRNIYQDQSECLSYTYPGGGGIYAMFHMREAIENHNCISWCEKHLQAIEVDLTNTGWLDKFMNDPKDKLGGSRDNHK